MEQAKEKVSRRMFLKSLGLVGAVLATPVPLMAAVNNNADPGGPGAVKAAEATKYRKTIPTYFYKRISKKTGYVGTTKVTDVIPFKDAREHGFAQFYIHGANQDFSGEWGQAVKKAMDDYKKLAQNFTEEQKEDAMWSNAIVQSTDNFHINLGPGRWESTAINKTKLELPPDILSAKIKKVAKWFGVDQVGICEISEDLKPYFYEIGRTKGSLRGGPSPVKVVDPGREIPWPYPHKYAIVLAKAEGLQGVKALTGGLNNITVGVECSDDDIYPRYLETVIRQLGYDSRGQSMNGTEDFNMIPLAITAGLGELGRHGLLVTPWGSHMRLSVVTTNMPLVADDAIDLGVQDFCKTCKKCADNCPSNSIGKADEPKLIRGVLRYEFNPIACMTQRATTGCASCAAVCPYTKPDNIVHSAGRFLGRNPVGADFLHKLDDLFYGKQPAPRQMTPDLAPWKL